MYAVTDYRNLEFTYQGPTGRASVISERAGKSRVITSYDGSINSSNLYDKARSVLDNIPQDCSHNQSIGHQFAKSATEYIEDPNLESRPDIVSADLSSFTDKINISVIEEVLIMINAGGFINVIQSPIHIGDDVVSPNHPLMGLRGTFELSSIAHHGIVHCVRSSVCKDKRNRPMYTMCGDDLLLLGLPGANALGAYVEMIESASLELNRSKTVVSKHTAIFCGKVYHKGFDVSPLTPPLYTFVSSFGKFISSAGSFADSSRNFSKGMKRSVALLLKSVSSRFVGTYVPFDLPFKLGGIGLPGSTSLISVLEKTKNRVFCNFCLEDELPPEVINRSVPYEDPNSVRVFWWTPNLLIKGFTKRYGKRNVVSPKDARLKSLYDCLEYFYS
jgi:hypothetical protein